MDSGEGRITVGERLEHLLSHLGITRAHFGTSTVADLLALNVRSPGRISAVAFMNPPPLAPKILETFGGKVIVFTGDQGPTASALLPILKSVSGLEYKVAVGSETALWTDYAAEQAEWLGSALIDFFDRQERTHPATCMSGPVKGEAAGISYRVHGEGPALVLLPASISPSQWDPLVEQLSEHFAVVVLTGAHLGYPALLEDRGNDPSCVRLLNSLFSEIDLQPESKLLEVGCGTGVFLRRLAQTYILSSPLTGVDMNAYFLKEASELAKQDGLEERLAFLPGNAEELPFDDASFDVVLSFTLLEECNAEKALAELFRVLKPGGHFVVVVRATDIPLYWHLPECPDLSKKVSVPNPLVGPAGCADGSIVLKLSEAGFSEIRYWLGYSGTADVSGPYWALYEQNRAKPRLSPEEIQTWDAAREEAARTGGAYMAQPVHCAVGRKIA